MDFNTADTLLDIALTAPNLTADPAVYLHFLALHRLIFFYFAELYEPVMIGT